MTRPRKITVEIEGFSAFLLVIAMIVEGIVRLHHLERSRIYERFRMPLDIFKLQIIAQIIDNKHNTTL